MVQLVGNMWLALLDIALKLHYSPFKSRLGGALEKHNDLYVILGSYALFYFTDFVTSPELKNHFGMIYIGLLCMMLFTNLIILIG